MHVLTVLGGFGRRLIPYAPFRARVEGGNAVRVERTSQPPASARVVVTDEGHRLEAVSGDPAQIVDVEAGPDDKRWLLQTSRVSLAFPSGYTLTSVPDGSVTPFDLLGDHGELIYMQSPRAAVSTSQLVADGQSVTEQAEDLIEVSYEHDGQTWYQRHQILRLDNVGSFVLTVQTPSDRIEPARAVLDEMARSARPT